MRKQLSHAALVLMAVAGLAACKPGGTPSPSAIGPGNRQPLGFPGHPRRRTPRRRRRRPRRRQHR